MTEIIRMRSAEPVVYGVLKIGWDDGHEAVVDLRPVFASGPVFDFLRRDPRRFFDLHLTEHGNSVAWTDDEGDEVDLGTESLRRRADQQAEILRRAG